MKLDDNIIPATVDQAVQVLFDALTESERIHVLNTGLETIHFTFGRYLRNTWGLWDRHTPLSRDFQQRFKLFGHGDDLSRMIIISLWIKVHGMNVARVQALEAEGLRQHWIKAGVNPETGEGNIL